MAHTVLSDCFVQAHFSQAAFQVTIRWASFCPLQHTSEGMTSLELRGGPTRNPDALLMFASDNDTLNESRELSRMSGGKLSFAFRCGPTVCRRRQLVIHTLFTAYIPLIAAFREKKTCHSCRIATVVCLLIQNHPSRKADRL